MSGESYSSLALEINAGGSASVKVEQNPKFQKSRHRGAWTIWCENRPCQLGRRSSFAFRFSFYDLGVGILLGATSRVFSG
jgi:hypothetical protein